SFPLYPPEPGPFHAGSLASADHHDEPESPGGQGSSPGGSRLPHQPEGRAGGRAPAQEGRSYLGGTASAAGSGRRDRERKRDRESISDKTHRRIPCSRPPPLTSDPGKRGKKKGKRKEKGDLPDCF